MTFALLKQHLSTEKLKPAYLISGSDAFLVLDAVKKFKSLVSTLPEFNITVFSNSVDENTLVDSLQALPLGDSKRVVFCYEFTGETQHLNKYLASPNPDSILVFVLQKPDSIKKVLSKIEIVDCNKLDLNNIIKYINAIASRKGNTIGEKAANLLVEYTGGVMTRIAPELEKLACYKLGGEITVADIEALVAKSLEYKEFELTNALGRKDAVAASRILTQLFETKVPEIKLLGTVYSFFRRLLYCKINEKEVNLDNLKLKNDYAIVMLKKAAQNFTALKLKELCDSFHEMDKRVKAFEIDPKVALEKLVLQTFAAV